MTEIRHDRPLFKYLDNLRRENDRATLLERSPAPKSKDDRASPRRMQQPKNENAFARHLQAFEVLPELSKVAISQIFEDTAIETELSSPVTTKASLAIAAEIRNHCKSLSSGGARMEFVSKLINEGDELSASAILGGPAFLSGLSNDQVALFTRLTPSLHPTLVQKLDGYDEDTAPILAATEEAFRGAYAGVRDVHEARDFARNNPAWTEAMQIINTHNLAAKQQERITRRFDRVHGDLMRGIEHIETELSSPVTTKASLAIAAEIRNHCKSLSGGGARMEFVSKLINEGDELSASAILGGPAFLSGLSNDQVALFTRLYHEKRQPALSKRLKAMKAATDLIRRNAPLIFGEMEKAVGCPPDRVRQLHEANTAAEKAMVFRDVA